MTTGVRVRHLDALTSLRFFAALAVVLYHCVVYFPVPAWLDAAFGHGYTGVGFFFVLSGFVLTWSRRDSSRAFFYGCRFARVWPAHAVMVFASIPVLYLEGHQPLWVALLPTLLLVQAWIPPGDWHYAFNGQSWSLSCEAFFYVIFPFVALWAARQPGEMIRRWLGAGVALMVIVAAAVLTIAPEYTWGALLYVNPAFRVGEFLLGIGLALAVERGRRMPRITTACVVVGGSYAALVLAEATLGHIPYGAADLLMLPSFIVAVGAFAARDAAGTTPPLLARQWLLNLGYWSFALYLVHQVIVRVVWITLEGSAIPATGWLAVTAGVAAVSVGASWVLYSAVEHPAERRIRAWVKARTLVPSHDGV